MEDATRVVQWNTTYAMVVFMYASMVVALAIFAYGTWLRMRRWLAGKPGAPSGPRWDHPGERLRRVLVRSVGQTALLKDRAPGIMHAMIFFGFLILFAATVVIFIDWDLKIPIMHGAFYLYFESLTVDLFGVVMLIGLALAAYRRYVRRLSRLELGRIRREKQQLDPLRKRERSAFVPPCTIKRQQDLFVRSCPHLLRKHLQRLGEHLCIHARQEQPTGAPTCGMHKDIH